MYQSHEANYVMFSGVVNIVTEDISSIHITTNKVQYRNVNKILFSTFFDNLSHPPLYFLNRSSY